MSISSVLYDAYRYICSYPNNQAGMPPAPPTHSTGYPSVDSQSTRTPSLYSHSFAAAGASQSPLTAASASHSTNMAHSRQHSTPLPNVPRYPMRGGHPTPTRGALSAMLSNTSSAPGNAMFSQFKCVTEKITLNCNLLRFANESQAVITFVIVKDK